MSASQRPLPEREDRAEAHVRAMAVGGVGRRPDRQGTRCSSSVRTRRTGRTAPANVIVGTVSGAPAAGLVGSGLPGRFTSPFREKLAFGKASFQPELGPPGRSDLQPAERDRHPRLRRTRRIEQLSKRPRTCATAWTRCSASGNHERGRSSTKPTVSYQRYRWNPTAGELRHHRRELLRAAADRRARHQPVDGPAAAVAAQRLLQFLKWRGNHTVKAGGIVSRGRTTTSARSSTATRSSPIVGDISWDFPRARQLRCRRPRLEHHN